jgi:hypothetical protein
MAGSRRVVLVASLLGMALMTGQAFAGPATHLSVSFTVVPCPDPGCTITTIAQGQAAPVLVTAQDAMGNNDPNYSGTVAFTSSDPLATIPLTHAFTAADGGVLVLPAGAIFETLGTQTLTATDAVNGFTSMASIDVVALRVDIPITNLAGTLALIAFLAASGAWMLRRVA